MATRLAADLVLREGQGRVMWEVPGEGGGDRLFVTTEKVCATPKYRVRMELELRSQLHDLLEDANELGLLDGDPFWDALDNLVTASTAQRT